jgi:hypothetical protein
MSQYASRRTSARVTSPSRCRPPQQRHHPVGGLDRELELSFQATNEASRTVSSLQTLTLLSGFLAQRTLSAEIEALTRKHLEALIADQAHCTLCSCASCQPTDLCMKG